jgi:hypothetical protein
MTSTMEISESIQDGFIKALETGQRLTLEAVGAGMSSLKEVVPDRPTVPFAEALVTPEEAINSMFRFVELLLQSQKSFLTELLDLAEPVTASSKKGTKD